MLLASLITNDPLFGSFHTRRPVFRLFSAAWLFKFTHILLWKWYFSYLFLPVFHIFHSNFPCLANLAPNGPYSMDFNPTERPFFQVVYWTTPFFARNILNDPPFFLGVSRRLLAPKTVSSNIPVTSDRECSPRSDQISHLYISVTLTKRHIFCYILVVNIARLNEIEDVTMITVEHTHTQNLVSIKHVATIFRFISNIFDDQYFPQDTFMQLCKDSKTLTSRNMLPFKTNILPKYWKFC